LCSGGSSSSGTADEVVLKPLRARGRQAGAGLGAAGRTKRAAHWRNRALRCPARSSAPSAAVSGAPAKARARAVAADA